MQNYNKNEHKVSFAYFSKKNCTKIQVLFPKKLTWNGHTLQKLIHTKNKSREQFLENEGQTNHFFNLNKLSNPEFKKFLILSFEEKK